jgi:citrate synthase
VSGRFGGFTADRASRNIAGSRADRAKPQAGATTSKGAAMAETAELRLGDKTIELPVVIGTEGERAIDISQLRGETGYITLDPGYANTGSCSSAITFIDGEKGILRYRGIPIEELAEKSTFLEVAHLLIEGELPKKEEFQEFRESIRTHTMIHEDMKAFYGALPKDAHPMAACSAAVGALSTFYPDSLDPRDDRHIEVSVHRLIAKLPTLAAYAFKHSIGQPFMFPRNSLSYPGSFLHMMFSNPCEDYEVDPVIEKAIDLLLILHADHEQNCSTSTVRLVGSSMVNLFATVSAGINSLWGPLHGGANQAVIEMLAQIRDEGLTGRDFVERAKSKDDTSRLMGFGHRVYKNFDPRAKIIKKACFEVLNNMGVHGKLLEIAVELEEIALKDEYFVERNLYPNVDFYSGVIYNAIGTPSNMFTALFALGRLPGWIAHWAELHRDETFKIGRPRQVYIGQNERSYVPISER